MSKLFLLYGSSALVFVAGFLCLFAAFRKKTTKEKMIKALQAPPPRNYGNPFPWMFGILLIVLATLLLFKTL
jgi:hypothetical protein